MLHPGKGAASSSGETLQEKAAAASSGVAPTTHPRKGAVDAGSSGGELPEKKTTASSGGSAAVCALHGNTTAQDCEESDAKYSTEKASTVSTAEIPHEHCTEDEAEISLRGGMLQKQSSVVDADTGSSEVMLHEHLAEEADTATGIKESDSNKIVLVEEEDTCPQVEDLRKKMNASCIGEQISDNEFVGYYSLLPRRPPAIDLDDELEDTALDKQEALHALYRFRYLKHQFPDQTSKEKLSDDKLKSLLDKSEDECTQKFLEEEFFRRFEKDRTLDWFIHPDYEDCSSLTDYQRLVLHNYGGTEYSRWSEYHQYLHSYKTEEEYVKYYKKLSEKLKWMDTYADIYCPSSLEWGYINMRGSYQAIKIAATDFHEITPTLAYRGFHECEESISYDTAWFKGYDKLYFEIWQRVTEESISFKDALKEVCNLKMFPLRQRMMENALEHDFTMNWMEKDYQTCTKAITSGDTEEKARKLIAEAVPTLVDKPKNYAQYITKKIEIARIVGILPREEESEE